MGLLLKFLFFCTNAYNAHHENWRGPKGDVESKEDKNCRAKSTPSFPGWLVRMVVWIVIMMMMRRKRAMIMHPSKG